MKDFAIVQTGGKQYRVSAGDRLEVELLGVENETTVELETLLTQKEGKLTIGKPVLKTKTTVKVVDEVKGEKIDIRKFKAKSRYRKHTGHRQKYSLIEIQSF